MSDRELHTQLTELHRSLRDVRPISDETKAVLAGLSAEIQPIVESGPAGPIAGGQAAGLRERLNAAMAAVETSHPQLAQAIGRVADTLAFYNL